MTKEFKFSVKRQKSIVELSGLELALIRQSMASRAVRDDVTPEFKALERKMSDAYYDLVDKRK